jgi:hypothetical protein
MPSPFPGMNPHLEQNDTWEDFHQRFITHAADTLSGKVGAKYLVKIEVRLYLHELPAGDLERHSSLEIREHRNRRVVTVIELLSPTNKTPGPDRNDYLHKRREMMRSSVHFVEIDLRRGGERPQPPALPPCDYYALVSREEERPRLGVWPLSLRDRMPVIPIPLTAPDPDVLLDLQAVLDRGYDAADYGKYIYDETPQPPLSEEDLAWARQFLPQPPNGPAAS